MYDNIISQNENVCTCLKFSYYRVIVDKRDVKNKIIENNVKSIPLLTISALQ